MAHFPLPLTRAIRYPLVAALTLWVWLLITTAWAVPIPMGESATWSFDTSTAGPVGAQITQVMWLTLFSGDLWNLAETIRWSWSDELGSPAFLTDEWTNPFPSDSDQVTILDPVSSGPLLDDDLYLTLTMVNGSVNVPDGSPTLQDISNTQLSVQGVLVKVPEPSCLLMLASGLGSLGVYSRMRRELVKTI